MQYDYTPILCLVLVLMGIGLGFATACAFHFQRMYWDAKADQTRMARLLEKYTPHK